MNSRAMFKRSLSVGSLTLGALLWSAGCAREEPGAEDKALEETEVSQADLAIINQVEELGFESGTIEVDGNAIRVDGDIILYRDKLLAGEYKTLHSHADAHQKGYGVGSYITGTNLNTAKIVWGTGTQTPSQAIKDAVVNAAGDYNSIAGSLVRISQNNPGPATITVRQIDASLWPPAGTLCLATDIACADFPSGGKPGANLYVKKDGITGACPNWSASMLANRMRHELGHIFGMTHSGSTAGTYITGTALCTRSPESDCLNNPNYSTIMVKTPAVYPGCTMTTTVLQTDDRNTMSALY